MDVASYDETKYLAWGIGYTYRDGDNRNAWHDDPELWEDKAEAQAEADKRNAPLIDRAKTAHGQAVKEWRRQCREFDALHAAGLRDKRNRPKEPTFREADELWKVEEHEINRKGGA